MVACRGDLHRVHTCAFVMSSLQHVARWRGVGRSARVHQSPVRLCLPDHTPGSVTVFVCAGASGQVSGVPGWLVRLIPRRAAVRDRNAYIGVLLRRPRHPDVT